MLIEDFDVKWIQNIQKCLVKLMVIFIQGIFCAPRGELPFCVIQKSIIIRCKLFFWILFIFDFFFNFREKVLFQRRRFGPTIQGNVHTIRQMACKIMFEVLPVSNIQNMLKY